MYGALSGVASWTRVGLDAAGSNLDDREPSSFLLEDAVVGWRSDDDLPDWGKDAIDLSIGAQDYQVGDGLLFWLGSSSGGRRGAYWISANSAFELTAIARLQTGGWSGELVWLTPNELPDMNTRIVGANAEYAFGTRANLGLGYWYFYDSQLASRDGLHVIDLRGWLAPLGALPDFVISGELVRQSNGQRKDAWGGWASASYTHQAFDWQPQLGYRFAIFTGDDPDDERDQAFDPLYYGADAWGTWNQGELIGQYVITNQNLSVHRLLASLQPVDSVTLSLLWFHYRIEQDATSLLSPVRVNAGDVESGSFGNEVDLVLDWQVNSHVGISSVLGIFTPAHGGREFFGEGDTWVGWMLYATLVF